MSYVSYISVLKMRERESEHAKRFGFDPKSISKSLDGFKQRSNMDFVFEKNHSYYPEEGEWRDDTEERLGSQREDRH